MFVVVIRETRDKSEVRWEATFMTQLLGKCSLFFNKPCNVKLSLNEIINVFLLQLNSV